MKAAMQVLATDLLPLVYDQVVKAFARRDISPADRKAVLLGLMNSCRLSFLAQTHEDPEKHRHAKSLVTSDRFCSKWASREDVVSHISKASGLDQRMSHLSLLFIEARVDVALTASDGLEVSMFGTLRRHHDIGSSHPEDRHIWYVQALLDHIHESNYAPGSLLSSWFGRPPRHLTALVEMMELSAAFRSPIAYEIELMPKTESRRRLKSKPEEPQWKDAFPAPKKRVSNA
jgi:hypothetical protein